MFDFLDKMMASDTPTAPMLGTSKEPTVNPNLDSSKVMDWFKSGKPKPAPLEAAPGLAPGSVQVQRTVEVVKKEKEKEKDPLVNLGPVNSIEKVRAWTKENLDQTKTLWDIFTVNNDGPGREEIEIELRHDDGESYTGTVTMQEAKYGIYRDGLGFRDFKNFFGVQFAFKGVRTVVLKLKEQINVDDLVENQYFDFKRSFKRLGKVETHCKIRGLRTVAMKEHIARKDARRNETETDGSVLIRITGCEYKVSAERLYLFINSHK